MVAEIAFLSFKIAIGLSLFYVAYALLLSRGTELRLRRGYLVGALLGSLLLPIVVSSVGWRTTGATAELKTVVEVFSPHLSRAQTVYLDPVVIRAKRPEMHGHTGMAQLPLVFRIYWYGVLVAGVLLLLRFLLFYRKYLTCKRHPFHDNVQLVYLSEKMAPFSFYRIIFIHPEMYSASAYQQILAHELAHIQCGHSYDKLLIELFVVLQWFNPFVYLFRRRLFEVHEYQADLAVVRQSAQPAEYARLLLSQVLRLPAWGMGSSFSYSLSKKRIKMIAKVNTNRQNLIKYLVFLPLIAIMVFFYACADSAVKGPEISDQFMDEMEALAEGDILTSYRFEYAAGQTLTEGMVLSGGKNYAFTYQVAEGEEPEVRFVNRDGERILPKEVRLQGKKRITEFSLKEDMYIEIVVEETAKSRGATAMFVSKLPYKAPLDENTVAITKLADDEASEGGEAPREINEDEVFYVVENMPKFQGQDQKAFLTYITENLNYPEEAAANGIEGRVFVSFIVSKEGKVTKAKVIRGVDPILDQEALRVVKEAPDWTPGTQRDKEVNVSFTFPIVFQLD